MRDDRLEYYIERRVMPILGMGEKNRGQTTISMTPLWKSWSVSY